MLASATLSLWPREYANFYTNTHARSLIGSFALVSFTVNVAAVDDDDADTKSSEMFSNHFTLV